MLYLVHIETNGMNLPPPHSQLKLLCACQPCFVEFASSYNFTTSKLSFVFLYSPDKRNKDEQVSEPEKETPQ